MAKHRPPRRQARFVRLSFQALEQRLCLSAELGFLLTSGESGPDTYGDIKVDSSGNIYVSSSEQIIKYSPSRDVLWSVDIDDAWWLDLDPAGNVYASGPLGTVNVPAVSGNVVLTGQGQTDVYVVKFNSAGLAVWGRAIGNSAKQAPGGMAVDNLGNVFVAGNFAGSLTLAGNTLSSAGNDDVFVARLTPSGTVDWGRRVGSASWDSAWGVDVDSLGNAYVTGNHDAPISLSGVDGDLTIPNSGSRDSFIVKVTPAGEFAWGVGIGGSTGATTQTLAVDPAGGVVVSGQFTGVVDFDPGPDVFTIPGSNDKFILKLDLEGQFLWAHGLLGTGGQMMEVSVGHNGQVHAAGIMYGTMNFDPRQGGYFTTSQWGDAFVVTLTSAGEFVAARHWGGTSVDVATSVAADSSGNIYVAGRFIGNFDAVDLDPGPGVQLRNSNGSQDGFIIQLTPPTGSIGNRLWHDANANGLQDAGENGLAGAVVELYSTFDSVPGNADDGRVGAVTTDSSGSYLFPNLASGNYYLKAHAPVGYSFSTPNVGTDETIDSDILATGESGVFVLQPGEQKLDQDVGLSGAAFSFGLAFRAGGLGQNAGNRMVTDAQGNVYVTGHFQGIADFDPGPTTVNLSAQGFDAFAAKYTAAGALVWAKRFGGSSNDFGLDLAVNGAGEVYLAGQFSLTIDVDPGPVSQGLTSAGNADIWLVKLTPDGYLIWAKSIGGTGLENVGGLEFDPAGNLVLAGLFTGTVDFNPLPGTSEVFQLTSAGSQDLFVLKLNTNGHFLSAVRWGGSSTDQMRDLAVDSLGNVYTIGGFRLTVDFDPAAGSTFNLTSAGGEDAFISKLNADGSFAWAVRYGSSADESLNTAIRVDSAGNVYTAGAFPLQVDFGGVTLSSYGATDGYVSKRNSAGQLQWVRQFGGVSTDQAGSLGLDATGNVYAFGSVSGQARFGDKTGTFLFGAASGTTGFIQKLNPDGQHLAHYGLAANGPVLPNSIAVDSLLGRIHVAGAFAASLDANPGPGAFDLTAQNSYDLFLVQFNQDNTQPRLSLAANVVTESQGLQTIGALTLSGAAPGENFTLQVLADLAGIFSIVAGQLTANTAFLDFETSPQVPVQIRAVGSLGTEVIQLFSISVLNANEKPVVAPIADIATNAAVGLSANGSFTDPDAGDAWTATVNYGDGGGVQPLVLLGNRTFELVHAYPAPGSYTVTVVVTDAGGLSDTRTLQVAVAPFPLPIVSISGSSAGVRVRGEPLTFQGSLTGQLPPGVNTITWNFGDGSQPISILATSNWQVQQHAFAAAGNYTVTLTMTAADGRTTSATTPVTILSALVQVDPVDPTVTTLVVGGTAADDMLRVVPAGANRLNVWLRAQLIGSYIDMDRVVLYGQDGNDFILGAATGNVDFWFFGGDGNDRLIGGAGNDVLLGEAGNDFAWGAGGRDLLVGGSGADVLTAKADDDLLIAAQLVLVNVQSGLADIMREWTSPRTFVDRVNNLKGDLVGTHENGNTLLLVAQTVLDDGEVDSLWGGSTNDWFFANSNVDRVEDLGVDDLLEDLAP